MKEIECTGAQFALPVGVLGEVGHPALVAPEVLEQVVAVRLAHHGHVGRQRAADVLAVVLALVLQEVDEGLQRVVLHVGVELGGRLEVGPGVGRERDVLPEPDEPVGHARPDPVHGVVPQQLQRTQRLVLAGGGGVRFWLLAAPAAVALQGLKKG